MRVQAVQHWFRRKKVAAICCAAAFCFPAGYVGAEVSVYDDTVAELETGEPRKAVGFRDGSFIVAPIPFSNPTIGSGLFLGAGYLYKTDEGSKPSVIGIGGFRSDNGSMGTGFTVNMAFDNNRWQFSFLLAEADVHYDIYTGLGALPIRQDGVLSRLTLAYGVRPDLSFGLAFRYLNTNVYPDIPGLPPIPPPYNKWLRAEIANAGVTAEWDTRDDTLYPTTGHHLKAQAGRGISLDHITASYNKGFVNYTHYRPVGEDGVFVARISGCAASTQTPFFDLCSLGSTDNFRGFSATQFLDNRSASIQVEYRHQLTKRFGAVAFGGVGQVGPHFKDLDIGGTHSAVGLGGRYRVSKKFPVDFSIDVAHNSLGENNLYIYVGQRF